MKNSKIILFLIVLLHFVACNSFAQITEQEALSKFVSAGMAYKDEQYDEAIAKYNVIIQGGWESGPVYYNLGNSYFRKDDLGRAVLNYERAKRFIPRDSDLNFNDRYVSFRIDLYGNGEKVHFLDHVVREYIDFYTIEEMVLIIIGAMFALGIIFLTALYMGWPKQIAQGSVVVFVLIAMIYGLGVGFKVRYTRNLAVILTATESYFEPRDDSTVHFKLPEGSKARILRTEGSWIKIERLDGKAGWVSSDVLERI